MKKLAFFALTAIATASYAVSPVGPGEIKINGLSEQVSTVNHGTVTNTSNAGTFAAQNLASNQGQITIDGTSKQTSYIENSTVTNEAINAGDVAVQSLASNVGKVKIGWGGESIQYSEVKNSTMTNEAEGNGCHGCEAGTAMAFQNGASNFGNVEINGKSHQNLYVTNYSTVTNKADGADAVAVQNLASNYGKVTIGAGGHSDQTAVITNGSLVANLALGNGSAAYQNMASNDYCMPPPPVCVGAACGPFSVAMRNW